jgi:hypothetical protein
MDPAVKPCVLFIYFTYTNQTRKVMDVMAEVLRGPAVTSRWRRSSSPIIATLADSGSSRCRTRSASWLG